MEVMAMSQEQRMSGNVELAEVDEALRDYECERISLGRLAELLGVDRDRATQLVLSRGIPLRVGPRTVEEALDELRAIERYESR
jgi:predicted HTH domain antitoxin